MSRSGYIDYWDEGVALYRGRVASVIRSERGQMLLRGMRKALDEMPVKELVAGELVTEAGAVCALGALGRQCGLEMSDLEPEDADAVAARFHNTSPILVREITYENDEVNETATPAERWAAMRKWVEANIVPDPVPDATP